jgi:hypothetical protein
MRATRPKRVKVGMVSISVSKARMKFSVLGLFCPRAAIFGDFSPPDRTHLGAKDLNGGKLNKPNQPP